MSSCLLSACNERLWLLRPLCLTAWARFMRVAAPAWIEAEIESCTLSHARGHVQDGLASPRHAKAKGKGGDGADKGASKETIKGAKGAKGTGASKGKGASALTEDLWQPPTAQEALRTVDP